MSQKMCHKCGYMFEHGDVVRAVIITKFANIPSEVAFALEQPTECLELGHVHCNRPKGPYEGD